MSEHEVNLLFDDLLDLNERISKLPVFPALAWVWAFDVLKDIYDNNQWDDVHDNGWADEAIAKGVTFKQVFDKFYEDVDGLGINMDLGGEILEEVIWEWYRDKDFMLALDEDSWLDSETNQLELDLDNTDK